MTVLPAFTAGFSSFFGIVGEITAALLSALVTRLGGTLRIIGEVAAALLSALVARLRGTLTIFGEVAGAATMLAFVACGHVTSPYADKTIQQ